MSRNGRSNTLLVELTIVLFFFSLAATVILNMFLTANDLSASGKATNVALYMAEDLAEALCASDNPDALLAEEGFARSGDRYERTADGMHVAVRVTTSAQEAGTLFSAALEVAREGDADAVLSALPATWYVPDAIKGAA